MIGLTQDQASTYFFEVLSTGDVAKRLDLPHQWVSKATASGLRKLWRTKKIRAAARERAHEKAKA